MLPETRENISTIPLRDRVRAIHLDSALPTDLPDAYARHAAELATLAHSGQPIPDAVLYPYRSRQTGRPAVYVWRTRAARLREVMQRLGPMREGAE